MCGLLLFPKLAVLLPSSTGQHARSQQSIPALSALSPRSLTPSVPGFAGLVTARQLQNKGYKVLVLEGHDRPGGRVYTKRLEVRWLCFPTTGPQRSFCTCNGLVQLSSQQQGKKEGHSPCHPGHGCYSLDNASILPECQAQQPPAALTWTTEIFLHMQWPSTALKSATRKERGALSMPSWT